MSRSSNRHCVSRRRGVALLIVIAMLALFAVVGLSFVFYAEMEADAARFRRQAEIAVDVTDPLDPEKLASFGLGQLLFGVDAAKNPSSKLAGHSLAESIYGVVGGTVAFNGIGRPRPDTTTQLASLTPFSGINVPYTHPDINNPFLAVIDGNGVFQARSFFRNGGSLRPSTLPPTNPSNPAEGDVRNVDSAGGIQGGTFNDAFWIDLGHPIIAGRDGTRFKPLYAFTIVDLDGRVNLGVSGNYLANYSGGGTTSRCGLGTFEINPTRLTGFDKAEIAKLFRGNSNPTSRYGPGANDVPANNVVFPPTKFYSRVDYSGTSTSVIGPPNTYSHFPKYGAWSDAVQRHPAGYDYFAARVGAAGSNTALSPSSAEAMFRWRDRGAPNLTSDLLQLLPNSLAPQGTTAPAALNLVTPYSMSLDTAHLAPFVAGDGIVQYKMSALDPYPKATAATQAIAPGVGETTAAFNSRVAGELRRINLNRGFVNPEDRLVMVQEIFDRLVAVTGAAKPSANAPFQPADRADQQYRATRWLAQLAANIVDYIDDDDDMTIFNWNPKSDPASLEAGDFVFGVELNRLVINEVYASSDNDKENDPGLADLNNFNATKYRFNVWAELFNPMSADAKNGGVAVLAQGNQPRYRLLLAADAAGIVEDPSGPPPSPTGLPTNLLYENNDPTKGVVDWPAGNQMVNPGDGSASGQGFFLVGPTVTDLFNDRKPNWRVKWDHSSPGMTSKMLDLPNSTTLVPRTATLVLQRVADPSRNEQPDPTAPGYNPFITVDYYSGFIVNVSLKYIGGSTIVAPRLGSFAARGRNQPLVASSIVAMNPLNLDGTAAFSTVGTEPRHTFGRQNSKKPGVVETNDTLKAPFDPIFHFDRPLVSTAELFHVWAVSPQQLTQRFPSSSSCNSAFGDVNSLLLRFLETVTTGDRSYNRHLAPSNPTGIAGAGRHAILVPGKINLNTVPDKTVLYALFDPQDTDAQGKTLFTVADVDAFWSRLKNITNSQAIAGFGDYSYSNGSATCRRTVLDLFTGIPSAAPATAGEYERAEGLRKVMNNITFTSNVFAVWQTVGFFEVDTNGNPTRELGRSEFRNVRRRTFAIIDRSQLVLPDVQLTTLSGGAAKGATTATLAAVSGSVSASPPVKIEYSNWTIRAGMALTIDKDRPNEETVMVRQIAGNNIQVGGFRFDHGGGATVHFGGIRGPQVPLNNGGQGLVLGNPGPQPNFNPRDYPYVVLHFSVIE